MLGQTVSTCLPSRWRSIAPSAGIQRQQAFVRGRYYNVVLMGLTVEAIRLEACKYRHTLCLLVMPASRGVGHERHFCLRSRGLRPPKLRHRDSTACLAR